MVFFFPPVKLITMNSDFMLLYEQLGIFSYVEDGFTIQIGPGPKKYLYADIEAIVAYKVDRTTYDEMRLEVIFEDCAVLISEDAPGWYQFVIRTKEIFPTIPQDWDLQMPFPSFEMNLMVLYKRPGDGG